MKCSLCGGRMDYYPDKEDGGLKQAGLIKCNNSCDPLCHENVKGHGSNVKEAYEVACDFFKTGRKI